MIAARPPTPIVALTSIVALSAALAILAPAGPTADAATYSLGANPAVACAALLKAGFGALQIDSSALQKPYPITVAEKGPTPASRVSPANPAFCEVLGRIESIDPKTPPIRFELNLPIEWNGRALQYGGGGFNGVVITGLGLPPAMPFDAPSPLARGFATYGADSGHESEPGEPPQAFALNDEAFRNFAYAAYKKVHDAAATLIERAYGRAPEKTYFMGSSEGGREALTMAQRYPEDFDGIFARVPVINWTGLQHAGMRNGLATMGEGWMDRAQVGLVSNAVIAQCGGVDGIVDDPVDCKTKFDPAKLACAAGAAGDDCLNEAQIDAIRTLHAPYDFPFALAHGVKEYPGWGVSGEANPSFGPTGGWRAWWLGSAPPTVPPSPTNGIAWLFGSGAIQYIYAQDPTFDPRKYRPEAFANRVREVSALMDSTDPDLSAFKAHGGKLIMLEHMSDYAQSPFAGIGYFQSVEAKMGADSVHDFMRLYTAPGVDHVGSGAPANVDMLGVLVDWAENGKPPGPLTAVEQSLEPTIAATRSLPLCEWPDWPHYNGGDAKNATSYSCVKGSQNALTESVRTAP
jgi:hypothetical protein